MERQGRPGSADSGRPLLVLAALGEETIMESNQEKAILANIQRVVRLLNTGALSMEEYEKTAATIPGKICRKGWAAFPPCASCWG